MQKAANKVHENPISYFLSDGTNSVEIACVWTKARNEHFYCFTNGVANAEGGTPITGLKTSITKTLQKKIKNLTGVLFTQLVVKLLIHLLLIKQKQKLTIPNLED
mgnify:CR=1 FL=1